MLFNDVFIIQLIIIYILFNFFFLDHAFYYLSFFFFLLMWLGFILCYLEVDIFTAILWIVELSVIIVFFLFSFFINNMYSVKKNIIKLKILNIFFLLPFFFFFNFLFSQNYVGFEFFNFLFTVNWINFYKSLNNNLDNDFSLLFFLYLNLNYLEFLFLATLISLGCIIAVFLFLLLKNFKSYHDYFHFKNINFIKKNFKFSFLRHQCFYKQQYRVPSIRLCKKKF